VESLAGRLLVAKPTMLDPNFARTVIYLVHHDADGAFGIVLNRPSEVTVATALESWAELATEPARVFVGGPVSVGEAVLGIGQARDVVPSTDGWQALTGTIGSVDLEREPADLPAPLATFRVFAGYSGWGAHQLESELARDDWFTVDLLADDVFTRAPDALWRTVLRRQGGDLAVAANYPLDPSAN
jgi:putative transcriptional regulator